MVLRTLLFDGYLLCMACVLANADSGLVHAVKWTIAKLADILKMEACFHGEKTIAIGDRGYYKKNWTIDEFEKAICPF